MINHGFPSHAKRILELLEDNDSALEIINLEWVHPFVRSCGYGLDVTRTGLESALENDFAGLGKYMIRLLKHNRSNIEQQVWDDGIKSALFFSQKYMALEIMTELVEGLALDSNFLSSCINERDKNSLLLGAIHLTKFKIAKYLLEKNANPYTRGHHGYTALHILGIKWNEHEMESPHCLATQLISKYPSLLYEKDDEGNLPFMKAA